MKRTRMTCLAALAVATVALTGCSSGDPYNVSYAAISGNLTPELDTMAQRPVDVDSALAFTNNVNLRLMSEDLGRVFLTNGPSRLTPYTIPNLSKARN